MLKNYFTISIRNIRKRKFFASITILGMTAGITACLLIALYVIDEFSYDRFHANSDRIYQVGLHKKIGTQDERSVSTCPPLADAMISEIPEVESVLRLRSGGEPVIRYGEKVVTEDKVFFTESNFFDFFSFRLISGNVKTALREPNSVVLTEKTARKLFGDENPLEKLVIIDDGDDKKIAHKVTGVAADCPGNSHFKFNILLSAGQDDYFKYNAWLNSGVFTYFLLRENTSASLVEKKLEHLVSKYVAPELKKFLGNNLDQFRNAGGVYSYYATKITDIHLKSTSQDGIEVGGSITHMVVFGCIGIFILAIACITLVVGLMLLVVGLLAGSYPAFYLTSFRPVEVLKGKVTGGFKSKGIRSALVVFQFAISIFLFIATSVVYTQIKFMQEQQMGMDKENVVLIEDFYYRLGNNAEAFRNAVAQQTGVLSTSFTMAKFPGTYLSTVMRSAQSEGEHIVASYWADFNSQDVLKFKMKEGRYFSKDFPSDSSAVVVNEAAARQFGFDKPEGQEILNSPNAFVFVPFHVIGIMKDFNFDSYHNKVRPLAVFLERGTSPILMVRYQGNAKTLIDNTSKLWKQYASAEPFAYSFMDENFDKVYRSEKRIGQVLSVFSGLAILIACLGLFALAAFTAEQRTREIGIRKVLGASVSSISMMLTKEFVVLVFVAYVPAATIGWWVSSQWLSGFAYRVEINLFIFVIAGVSAIAIAWLTVGYQSIKAARANPVDSLRHD